MIYKLMPRVDVRWHDVWLGAFVTALLFTVGKFLIGLYIGKSGIASGFGAAGSLIVVFVWVYYSAQIFLMGAEFTWVYATKFGSMRCEQSNKEARAPTCRRAPRPAGTGRAVAVAARPSPAARGARRAGLAHLCRLADGVCSLPGAASAARRWPPALRSVWSSPSVAASRRRPPSALPARQGVCARMPVSVRSARRGPP